jgi:hypothetical protein
VYKIQKENGDLVAAKYFTDLMSDLEHESIIKEIDRARKLRHPFIVKDVSSIT